MLIHNWIIDRPGSGRILVQTKTVILITYCDNWFYFTAKLLTVDCTSVELKFVSLSRGRLGLLQEKSNILRFLELHHSITGKS